MDDFIGNPNHEMTSGLEMAIGGLLPTGPDPRTTEPVVSIYRQLRDSRNEARQDERQQEASENAGKAISLSPAWQNVREMATRLLADHAKDVEALVWLTEAETRLDGHAGLARSLRLIRQLIQNFGTALHPQPEEPDDDTFAALAGLNGVGREGTLIQPLRLVPLVPGSGWGENSLWMTMDATTSPGVASAMAAAGPAAMGRIFADIRAAQEELALLDQVLTDELGGAAPPTAQIRAILDDTERTVRRLAELTEPQAAAPESQHEPAASPAQATATGPITSREEAFDQLLRISAYFRKAEPHSPIGFALETLVRRGRMDFLTLLQELIPDDSARASVMTNAGIRNPDGDNSPE